MITQFVKKIGNPPIHNDISKSQFDDKQSSLVGSDMLGSIHANWQKYMQQLTDDANLNNYYGFPSVAVNSDFYWNTGVASPITTDTYFSEKWLVFGAASATFTLTQESFSPSSTDQIGSNTYINIDVSSYTSGDFYLYQRQNGDNMLRRFQGRLINYSLLAFNNQNKTINLSLEIFFNYDPTSETFKQGIVQLVPGVNELAGSINTTFLGDRVIGAGAYVDFRFRFVDLIDGTANFNLIYLKPELSDQPTILYVDHALERTRIDNSTWVT